MTTRWHTLLPSLGVGLTMVLALLALCSGAALPARAALAPGLGQGGGPCTVCLEAGVCAYTTIQAAVNDEGCQEIKVAQGVYTGVQGRPAPAGYPWPPASGLITQVVYISRTVTVRGGYTPTNWATPYPLTQPTTLDAGGLGRALVVAGDISPTIEGLGLTNGNAAGLGGDDGWGTGGGVYIISTAATLSTCRVFSNTADHGGGLGLTSSNATLISNSVTSNTASKYGGGLGLWYSPATLSANSVTSNTVSEYGGGLFLWKSDATLSANSVTSNTATSRGGGLGLYYSPATLISNSVTANTANYGGGLDLYYSPATLISNSMTANTANYGGGLYLYFSPARLSANSVTSNTAGGGLYQDGSGATLSANSVTSNTVGGGLYLKLSNAGLTNTVVADNRAGTNGSGLYVYSSSPRLVHTTLARNGGGDGSGVYVTNKSSVWLTNTILVSQTVGITVAAGSTATLNSTLWYGNGADWDGAGRLARTGDITGDPAFADPDGGDYHLTASSAAIDQGVAAGVTTDKDGQPRDARPDLGAY